MKNFIAFASLLKEFFFAVESNHETYVRFQWSILGLNYWDYYKISGYFEN